MAKNYNGFWAHPRKYHNLAWYTYRNCQWKTKREEQEMGTHLFGGPATWYVSFGKPCILCPAKEAADKENWNTDLIWLGSVPVMPLYILGLQNSSGGWSGAQLGSPQPHRSLPTMEIIHVYYRDDLFWKCSWPRALELAYREYIQHLN